MSFEDFITPTAKAYTSNRAKHFNMSGVQHEGCIYYPRGSPATVPPVLSADIQISTLSQGLHVWMLPLHLICVAVTNDLEMVTNGEDQRLLPDCIPATLNNF